VRRRGGAGTSAPAIAEIMPCSPPTLPSPQGGRGKIARPENPPAHAQRPDRSLAQESVPRAGAGGPGGGAGGLLGRAPADRRGTGPDQRAGPGHHRGAGPEPDGGRDAPVVPRRGGDERPARRRADSLGLQVRDLRRHDRLPRGDRPLPRPPARRRAVGTGGAGDPERLRHAHARADLDGAGRGLPVPGQVEGRLAHADAAPDQTRLVDRLPAPRRPWGHRDQLARRRAEDVPGRGRPR